MNKAETSCCLKPNGKKCKSVDSVEDDGVEWDSRRRARKLMSA